MCDVIVVGARVAGAATAMPLARGGLDVLVVDRATFPSDTLSTHQVQVAGVARLHRWGGPGRIVAAGTPATPGSGSRVGRVRGSGDPALLGDVFTPDVRFGSSTASSAADATTSVRGSDATSRTA
jgi:2-polyprenyl-6-methoxyphenol hydroxylase-like FAD-dependent oxidoreductase